MAIGATSQSSVTRFRPGSRGRRAIQTDGAGSADRKKRTVQGTLGDNSIRGYGKHTSQLRVVNILFNNCCQSASMMRRLSDGDRAYGQTYRQWKTREIQDRSDVDRVPQGLSETRVRRMRHRWPQPEYPKCILNFPD